MLVNKNTWHLLLHESFSKAYLLADQSMLHTSLIDIKTFCAQISLFWIEFIYSCVAVEIFASIRMAQDRSSSMPLSCAGWQASGCGVVLRLPKKRGRLKVYVGVSFQECNLVHGLRLAPGLCSEPPLIAWACVTYRITRIWSNLKSQI